MQSSVYFANPGKIDLDFIRLMGPSIKGIDNPIGYFGTGLKYAIATLLRTGHTVTLYRGTEIYEFTAREITLRGEPVQRIFMNDEPLPFTNELGRNWEVWHAYRELHSNTLDEVGRIADKETTDDTTIVVTGEALHMEYLNRDKIFLATKPLDKNSQLEVHPGKSDAVYYRGVRAGFLPNESSFTYNFLCQMRLTEDRTFASQWDVEWRLATLIPTLQHRGVVSTILDKADTFDGQLDFSNCGAPSTEFLEGAAQRYTVQGASPAAKQLVERDMQNRAEYPPCTLLDHEHDKLLAAFAHLGPLGCTLSPEEVEVVESLGPNAFAIYHKAKDQIFLARMTLDWGMETLVATLYEEWLHKVYHYKDKTAALQNFLFQRLAALSMGITPPAPEDQNPKPATDDEADPLF